MPSPKTTTDILVIGAGIAGAGLAWQLAGSGLKVTLLDMESRPGFHATGRSAAMFEPLYGPPLVRELTAASAAFYADHFSAPRGTLMACEPGDDALYAEGLALGFEEISKAEAHRLLPRLKDGPVHFLFDPRTRDLDVDGLHQFCLKAHRQAGGQLVTDAELISARFQHGAWQVETRAGAFQAAMLVNAAGAWADVVAGRAGVRPLGITPKRRSIALVPFAGLGAHWPQFFPAREDFYCKPQSGLMLISPADADACEPHDAFPDDLRLAEGIAAFERLIDFEVQRIEASWAGLRSFAPDGEPVAGFDPEAEGFFWLVGQGGYGIQTAPALASLAARLIRQETREDRLAPVRLRR